LLTAPEPTSFIPRVAAPSQVASLPDADGERVSAFDPEGEGVPKGRQWFEPKRGAITRRTR